jgi:hypothetical protein
VAINQKWIVAKKKLPQNPIKKIVAAIQNPTKKIKIAEENVDIQIVQQLLQFLLVF